MATLWHVFAYLGHWLPFEWPLVRCAVWIQNANLPFCRLCNCSGFCNLNVLFYCMGTTSVMQDVYSLFCQSLLHQSPMYQRTNWKKNDSTGLWEGAQKCKLAPSIGPIMTQGWHLWSKSLIYNRGAEKKFAKYGVNDWCKTARLQNWKLDLFLMSIWPYSQSLDKWFHKSYARGIVVSKDCVSIFSLKKSTFLPPSLSGSPSKSRSLSRPWRGGDL